MTGRTHDIGLQASVPLQTQILIHSISSHRHLDERLCFHVFPCIGWVLPYLLFSIGFYRHLSVSLCWSPDSLRQLILMVTILTGSTICQGCGGSRFMSNEVLQAFIPAQRSWMLLSFPTDSQRILALKPKAHVMDSTYPRLSSRSLRLAAFALCSHVDDCRIVCDKVSSSSEFCHARHAPYSTTGTVGKNMMIVLFYYGEFGREFLRQRCCVLVSVFSGTCGFRNKTTYLKLSTKRLEDNLVRNGTFGDVGLKKTHNESGKTHLRNYWIEVVAERMCTGFFLDQRGQQRTFNTRIWSSAKRNSTVR